MTRSLRGVVEANTKKRVIVDDGRTNQGFKVVEFYAWAINPNDDTSIVLGLDEESIGTTANAGNNSQIGWARSMGSTNIVYDQYILDPNHVVIQDLVVMDLAGFDTNYLIVIEEVSLSDDEAILALIKERGQGVN